jgi:hypothetical protein
VSIDAIRAGRSEVMKIVHGSLRALLQEVHERKVEAVRVAAFMQSDIVPDGMPRYTAWVVVTAILDGTLWSEWRLLVGRGHAEVTDQGAVAPARIGGLLKQRTMEVRRRVADAGRGVRDGILAHDAEAMDGAIE